MMFCTNLDVEDPGRLVMDLFLDNQYMNMEDMWKWAFAYWELQPRDTIWADRQATDIYKHFTHCNTFSLNAFEFPCTFVFILL